MAAFDTGLTFRNLPRDQTHEQQRDIGTVGGAIDDVSVFPGLRGIAGKEAARYRWPVVGNQRLA